MHIKSIIADSNVNNLIMSDELREMIEVPSHKLPSKEHELSVYYNDELQNVTNYSLTIENKNKRTIVIHCTKQLALSIVSTLGIKIKNHYVACTSNYDLVCTKKSKFIMNIHGDFAEITVTKLKQIARDTY